MILLCLQSYSSKQLGAKPQQKSAQPILHIYFLNTIYIYSIKDTTENKAPTRSPIKHIEYECKQSKYGKHVPKLPMHSMILSPSGSWKTVLLHNMILDICRGCFNRIYIFSPSIDIDHTWRPVKDYIAKNVKPHDRENIF